MVHSVSEPDSAECRGKRAKTQRPIRGQRQDVVEDAIINREPAQ